MSATDSMLPKYEIIREWLDDLRKENEKLKSENKELQSRIDKFTNGFIEIVQEKLR